MFKLWITSWNGPFYYNGLCNYTFPMHGSEDDPTTITWLLENGGAGRIEGGVDGVGEAAVGKWRQLYLKNILKKKMCGLKIV